MCNRTVARPDFPGERTLAPVSGADCRLRTLTSGYVPVRILKLERRYGTDWALVRVVETCGAYPAGLEEWVSPDDLVYPSSVVLFPGRLHFSIGAGEMGRPARDFVNKAGPFAVNP